jgi:hypothetical protein
MHIATTLRRRTLNRVVRHGRQCYLQMLGIPCIIVVSQLVPVLSLYYCPSYLRPNLSKVWSSSEATTTNLEGLAPSIAPSLRNPVCTLLNLTRAFNRWQRVAVT